MGQGCPRSPRLTLLYQTYLSSASPYTSSMLNSPLLCFAVALISQVLALLGTRIVAEDIQLLVPTHDQTSAAGITKETCSAPALVFGSASGGNSSVPTETPSTQLTSQASDGNKSGYLAVLANTHGWACSGDLLGRRTGKREPRYTFNADIDIGQ